MNSFYYASLTLEVVVRDRGSYNIYMTKIFQEVAVVFIRKYFFVSTNLANVFDRASPLNSFGFSTGKSLSEAVIFSSTNLQYDDRLFVELQVQYMKLPSSNLGRTCCVQKLFLTFRTIFVHNMFSPCSAKRRASEKDLSVRK